MQRAAALVRTRTRISAVLEQPFDCRWTLVVGRVYECFVEDVLRALTRAEAMQPADVGGIGTVVVRVGDQTAASVQEPLEPVDAPCAGSHPGCVRHELDRGEDVGRSTRSVIDRALQRRDAVDPDTVQARAGPEQDLDEVDAVKARREVERPVEIAAALDEQVDAGPIDTELVGERACARSGIRTRALSPVARR